jgi:hypothetical protein
MRCDQCEEPGQSVARESCERDHDSQRLRSERDVSRRRSRARTSSSVNLVRSRVAKHKGLHGNMHVKVSPLRTLSVTDFLVDQITDADDF